MSCALGPGPLTRFGAAAAPAFKRTHIGQGAETFLDKFADADWMWVRFDKGYEGMWSASLSGSREASFTF
jgi:hypothetical protein